MKKNGRGKVIVAILGLIVLIGGLIAGVILIRQKQIFKEKASGESYNCPGCGTCTNSCTVGGFNWDGNQYTVPAGSYSIKNKCAGVNLIVSGQACSCPLDQISDPWGEGYDTCRLPDVERYFVRGGAGKTNGWDSNYCGTQQVDITWGSPSYWHSIANISSAVCDTSIPTATATATATATSTATSTATATGTATATATGTSTATATATPTATSTTESTVTATAQPQLPDAGTSWPTIFGTTFGILVIIFSLILAL